MINEKMLEHERKYQSKGYRLIAGMDEAGRGPLAGPVVCAIVILPLDIVNIIDGVNDSKKLSERKREELYQKITEKAIDYKIFSVDEKVIDSVNILNATKLGMKKCVENLVVKPDIVLVDAVNRLDVSCECLPIIKGDELSYSIAAASILAKVTRDRIMLEMDKEYPEYSFAKHKGYGTALHIQKLKECGKSVIHRESFLKNISL